MDKERISSLPYSETHFKVFGLIEAQGMLIAAIFIFCCIFIGVMIFPREGNRVHMAILLLSIIGLYSVGLVFCQKRYIDVDGDKLVIHYMLKKEAIVPIEEITSVMVKVESLYIYRNGEKVFRLDGGSPQRDQLVKYFQQLLPEEMKYDKKSYLKYVQFKQYF